MIFTIGHSTMEAGTFAAFAREHRVDVVMDIRSHPGSTKWPWFNRHEMERWLPRWQIAYDWEPRLGGFTAAHLPLSEWFFARGVDLESYAGRKFPKHRIGRKRKEKPLPLFDGNKPTWTNQGLYDFSWFTALREFRDGADRLVEMAQHRNVAIMCCELLWWKCHRSMVSDYLHWRGHEAIHLQPKITPHSRVISNRIERYDAEVVRAWGDGGFDERCR